MTELPVYTELGFSDEEWGLLVGLPQAVLNAASAAESDGGRRTRAENAAGLETIGAGRESASPLVTAVAGELVSRVGDPETGEELPVIEPADPQALIADVLARAGTAARLLADRVDDGEAGAYKHWLVGIAEQVVGAATTGGVLGIGGEAVTESERRFRDRLAHVLND
ncbi:hypothetical protein O7543_07845 [Solwaraspora sp. WMMA2080]|uniref:hypothetical protein n=1 Tax=unclassified Solwaraspora TaxID=2627926 RepID=UPI00248B669D|nr:MULTISPECIES: hypothetical protein [unclassified Solwaraspora]WBB99102.1 hypothetical protein O7553_09520 [Solwaraspora sp. WMMA2059]WBC22345.1 hypothetical protein O7543_07845 [Solwaraspora sp. WMMA2080]